MFKLAVTFVAAAALVLAQDNTTIPACILTCSTTALASTDCGAITNLTCICTDTAFQTAVGACVTTTCPDQLEAAITLQTAECSGNTTDTASGTATGTSTGTTTRATGAGTTTPRPTTGTGGSTTRASTSSTSSNSGFHTAGLASGAALALFGAAFSLF